MKLYLTVDLICVLLITSENGHLFTCVLVIFLSSLEKCHLEFFVYFFSIRFIVVGFYTGVFLLAKTHYFKKQLSMDTSVMQR